MNSMEGEFASFKKRRLLRSEVMESGLNLHLWQRELKNQDLLSMIDERLRANSNSADSYEWGGVLMRDPQGSKFALLELKDTGHFSVGIDGRTHIEMVKKIEEGLRQVFDIHVHPPQATYCPSSTDLGTAIQVDEFNKEYDERAKPVLHAIGVQTGRDTMKVLFYVLPYNMGGREFGALLGDSNSFNERTDPQILEFLSQYGIRSVITTYSAGKGFELGETVVATPSQS